MSVFVVRVLRRPGVPVLRRGGPRSAAYLLVELRPGRELRIPIRLIGRKGGVVGRTLLCRFCPSGVRPGDETRRQRGGDRCRGIHDRAKSSEASADARGARSSAMDGRAATATARGGRAGSAASGRPLHARGHGAEEDGWRGGWQVSLRADIAERWVGWRRNPQCEAARCTRAATAVQAGVLIVGCVIVRGMRAVVGVRVRRVPRVVVCRAGMRGGGDRRLRAAGAQAEQRRHAPRG